jgi:hypothetical protein
MITSYMISRATTLRIVLAGCVAFVASSSWAQTQDKMGYSTGRSAPEIKGEKQPQGWTGPTDTGVGGAPPESPQGQSPPGMQAAPEGSSKTTVGPDK